MQSVGNEDMDDMIDRDETSTVNYYDMMIMDGRKDDGGTDGGRYTTMMDEIMTMTGRLYTQRV